MIEQLRQRFEALDPGEQSILLALSVVYSPIAQTRFQQMLVWSECVPASVSSRIGKPLRQKLERLMLIEVTRDGWMCARPLCEILTRRVVDTPLFHKLADHVLEYPAGGFGSYQTFEIEKIRDLRIHLYRKNEGLFLEHLHDFSEQHGTRLAATLNKLFFSSFDAEWFHGLPINIRLAVLQNYQWDRLLDLEESEFQYRLMDESLQTSEGPSEAFVCRCAVLYLVHGDLDAAEQLLDGLDSVLAQEVIGMLRFMQNRSAEALEILSAALKRLRKETRKRTACLNGFSGYFYCLLLLQTQSPENLQTLRKYLKTAIRRQDWSDGFGLARERLLKGLDIFEATAGIHDPECEILTHYHTFGFDRLLQVLLFYWLGEAEVLLGGDPVYFESLNQYCRQADEHGYIWFASVCSNLLERLSVAEPDVLELARKYRRAEFTPIIDLLPRIEPWQRSLDALTKLVAPKTTGSGNLPENRQCRMIWIVQGEDGEACLMPREQRRRKNGNWTRGRAVAIRRLHRNPEEFDYLTDHDRRICDSIEVEFESGYYGYSPKEVYRLGEAAIYEAVGHPHIYRDEGAGLDNPVTISGGEVRLQVLEQEGQLLLSLSPNPDPGRKFVIEDMAADMLHVYRLNEQHHQVAVILGREGLRVPVSARQQVIDSITSIASVLTVQSNLAGTAGQAKVVMPDSRLHVLLHPVGEGIQVEVFVRPFTDGGPVFKPAAGGATVLAELDGQALQTARDFEQERDHLARLLENCPGLYDVTDPRWVLEDPEMALEALLQLQALGEFAVLEWPRGRPIRISRETGLSHTQLSVRKERDWFSVSGEVQVDDDQVLEVQKLIRLLAVSPGRFLKLEDGQIIALTRDLRNRLDDLAATGNAKGKGLQFHALAAQSLQDLTEGMPIRASESWKKQLARFGEAGHLQPQVPSTMQGNLRDYQLQGFQWMVRLAHLNAGACLADDMGLGKTIQALAFLLYRAAGGPALILAPTSVCTNWLEEAARFAPTLNTVYFGSGDRDKILDRAGPMDLVVCSYGLLQTEADRLTGKKWHTIVADEAQAIKNPQTRRSRAAMKLQSDFRMVATGTPIENHPGELWNLFNFINPGLLGSLESFNKRYANNIENSNDSASRVRLKKLIQPFILRRLKNDVLSELPERTEVTLHVQLSETERNLYEALRRNAVENMEQSMDEAVRAGQRHLKVLAELMKLRRACCHPRLVLPESEIGSAKLQAFGQLLDELIANRHKALVFSQFVDHLSLIREYLEQKGIEYQYLDGSTSRPRRKAAVDAFQSGQGDLFLISLKAGGAGLNLTAADYVVHMDPWWNPAVEDQASDRAHRIGQNRPVTIYRLVAQDTIEDKIVELHTRKRDLANCLLEGGELSGKISMNELLELIREAE